MSPTGEIDAPLSLHAETVRPEWIDYNGHMNVAYYLLAFDHATDAFFNFAGIDDAYRRRANCSTFAVEAHITYERELRAGDPMRFATQLLDFDDKRLHFFHAMHHAEEGFLAATSEWLSLHLDMTARRVTAMPEALLARLGAIRAAHDGLPRPPQVGRVIRAAPRNRPAPGAG